MIAPMVSQQELRRARELQDAYKTVMSGIAARIARGARIEPGELATLGPCIVPTGEKREAERFHLLAKLFAPEDL